MHREMCPGGGGSNLFGGVFFLRKQNEIQLAQVLLLVTVRSTNKTFSYFFNCWKSCNGDPSVIPWSHMMGDSPWIKEFH